MDLIEPSWKTALDHFFNGNSYKELMDFIEKEYRSQTIFPAKKDIFNAFEYCPLDQVKVVILGQDPYHGFGQAHGLSFSVAPGIPFPPSLLNIFKEIKSDLGNEIPSSGDLTSWAKQGVFLLNATLTVRAGQAGSHQGKGWEEFTDEVIRVLDRTRQNVIFMLWGGFAQKKSSLIDESKHLILKAPHPSPLSCYRGFFGSKHFSAANEYLISKGKTPIIW